jgi:gamma-glutamyltranspeptidase/glutathione hydrolase
MAGSDDSRTRQLGVVAAGSAQSVAAGTEILRAGGNAADALVAAVFATAAGDPSITSLAGGAAAIFRSSDGTVEIGDFFANAPGIGLDAVARDAIDFREVGIDFGVGESSQCFHIGRGSAAVPGAVPGLIAALDRWGTLSLSDVVAPAVRLLRGGFPLSVYQSECLKVLRPILLQTSQGRQHFQRDDGELLQADDRFCNTELADTLERLGSDPTHYERSVVPAIVEEFGPSNGGQITERDLVEWKPRFRDPLTAFYGGVRVHTNPAPAQGGRFVLLTLELCEHVGLRHIPHDSPERQRLLASVLRAISEVRSRWPEIVDRTDAVSLVQDRLENILNGNDQFLTEPSGPSNTTHVSVVDRHGNAAGATLSHGEGCGHWIGETGLHMNNLLGEEDLFPAGFHNFIPGARLTTMMAPTVMVDRNGGVCVLGSGGANRIRSAISQTIIALVDDRLDLEDAVARNRIHFENGVLSAEIYGEPGDESVYRQASEIAEKSQFFAEPSLFFGGVHLAQQDAEGRLHGVGDPRRGGCAHVVT